MKKADFFEGAFVRQSILRSSNATLCYKNISLVCATTKDLYDERIIELRKRTVPTVDAIETIQFLEVRRLTAHSVTSFPPLTFWDLLTPRTALLRGTSATPVSMMDGYGLVRSSRPLWSTRNLYQSSRS